MIEILYATVGSDTRVGDENGRDFRCRHYGGIENLNFSVALEIQTYSASSSLTGWLTLSPSLPSCLSPARRLESPSPLSSASSERVPSSSSLSLSSSPSRRRRQIVCVFPSRWVAHSFSLAPRVYVASALSPCVAWSRWRAGGGRRMCGEAAFGG